MLSDSILTDWKKVTKNRFCLAFFDFQKKPSTLKKARISKFGFKSQIGSPAHTL